ncbi:hypothetical protein LGH70_02945 [Hymenobacter sp. BT635]|uniref:Uncharacterized protein n=1 Tax=Hymenobacter nitidus TaxID=2880929 RepID=A0ABS8A9E0_9BACT|nr:hypothetical protein [Hymenobacter nitidus]MCB2376521.1 hypothetical protein [Hymenobacter nitidus]
MAKDKDPGKAKGKKKEKKARKQPDLLDNAATSLKKFRKVTRSATRLTTGQKVVGGIALLAAGLTYWAKKQAAAAAAVTPDAQAAEAHLATLNEPPAADSEAAPGAAATKAAVAQTPRRKSRKSH